MSFSCTQTIQLYPSYVNNVIMYQTKQWYLRLNISVKEAEFETRYQLWTSTGTCARCHCQRKEQEALPRSSAPQHQFHAWEGKDKAKGTQERKPITQKDPILQSATKLMKATKGIEPEIYIFKPSKQNFPQDHQFCKAG